MVSEVLPKPSEVQVFAYVRVSTAEQDQKGALVRAEATMREWLKENGYTHAKLYVEVKSGGEDDRPKWLELQRDIVIQASRNVSKRPLIVVRETSRWARDEYDWFHSMKPLRDLGIQLLSISPSPYMTSTKERPRPNDDLLFGVLAGVAQQAKEEGRVRTLAGLHQTRKKGKTGGSIPWLIGTVDVGSGAPRGTGYRQLWAMARKDYNPKGQDLNISQLSRAFPHPITEKKRATNTTRNLLTKMMEYQEAGVLEGWLATMDVLTDLVRLIGAAVPAGKVRGAPASFRERKTPSRLMDLMRGYSGYLQDPIEFVDFQPSKADLLGEAEVSEAEFDAAFEA